MILNAFSQIRIYFIKYYLCSLFQEYEKYRLQNDFKNKLFYTNEKISIIIYIQFRKT